MTNMKTIYIVLLLVVATATAFVHGATRTAAVASPHEATAALPKHEGRLPSFDGVTTWINSPALTPAGLRGKVVVVDFWTYSCINWRRSLPYVRAWSDKYKDQGLVVIGVHSPEFEFEKALGNVRWAAKDMDVRFPIAVDNDFQIWRAFGNQHWPALYIVDAEGRIRYHHFGEGDYDGAERLIQRLLREAGGGKTSDKLVSIKAQALEAAADWGNLRSAENYLGHRRTEGFSSPGGLRRNEAGHYRLPDSLAVNHWSLGGKWIAGSHSIALAGAHGRIQYRFHARDLHLVMGSTTAGKPVRFRILIDGAPPRASHGVDVDESGFGTVVQHRMYQLVRQRGEIAPRLFEIEFLDSGADAYSFTFG